MTKAVTDILRRKRRECMRLAESYDKEAAHHEKLAADCRDAARDMRNLHCQCGAGIQKMEGDLAVLDLPEEPPVLQPQN